MKRDVIVGLDDSPGSRAALRWAAAYAASAGAELSVIHVLDWPIGLIPSTSTPGTRLHVPVEEVALPYQRGLRRIFDGVSSPRGSTLRFAQGDVGDVLVQLSVRAGLLVVGTREPVQGRSYRAGAVGHHCITHARCPVVIVPELHPYLAPETTALPTVSTAADRGGHRRGGHRPVGHRRASLSSHS